jgi:ubiquinone/menaquinone biosynthesis C-methylase UbiE
MGSWLSWIEKGLPKKSPVLELGCGMGLPVAKRLAGRFRYLGADLSDLQIKRAKKTALSGKFVRADMTHLKFPSGSFRAVLAFYSIIHLPLREHRPLLGRIFRWLEPGGFLRRP